MEKLVNHLFKNPRGGTPINNADILNSLQIQPLFNINKGTQDFLSNYLPQGLGFDIGGGENFQ